MITSHIQHRTLCALIALSLSYFCCTPQAHAGSIVSQYPSVVVQANQDPNTQILSPGASSFVATSSGGDYALTSQMDVGGIPSATVTVQQLEFNNDPFVLNNFLVTNNLLVPQVFTVTVGLPTSLAGPNLISGSVRTSVIDGGSDGASISTIAGQALYQAQIDFGTVATLQNDPFVLTAAAGSSATASATFGMPVPIANGIPVTSNIGIQLRFTLSPGDTATILSRFDIVPGGTVPEPTTLVLSGMMAALAYGFRGRRGC